MIEKYAKAPAGVQALARKLETSRFSREFAADLAELRLWSSRECKACRTTGKVTIPPAHPDGLPRVDVCDRCKGAGEIWWRRQP